MRILYLSITTLILFWCTNVFAAMPTFNLTPLTATTIQIPKNGTTRVSYTVTNNTKITRTMTLKPITAVTQVTSGGNCANPFTLGPQQTCTLALDVSGAMMVAAQKTELTGGPIICKTMGNGNNNPNPFYCAQPAAANVLSVTLQGSQVTVGNATIGGVRFAFSYTGTGDSNLWGNAFVMTAPSGGTLNNLNTVACENTATNCVAVGVSTISGVVVPLVHTSSDGGTSWSSPILPSLPAGGTANNLNGVACDANTATWCVTVGFSTISGVVSPIAYTSSNGGASWSSPILLSIPAGGTANQLFAVACDSTGLICKAAGNSTIAGVVRPMFFTSNDGGNTWSSPNVLAVTAGWSLNGITGITCSSSGTQCTAAGSVTISGLRVPLTYVTSDNGATWTAALPTAPVGGTVNLLRSVACNLSTGFQCVTVGSGIVSTVRIPFSYTSTDGGISWVGPIYQTIPNPGFNNFLTYVSCDATGLSCITVGNYTLTSATTPTFPFSYSTTNGGLTWSSPALPTPPTGATTSGLNSVFVAK